MGETGSSSDGQGHAQFNLIFVGWSCVPFLLLGLRPNYGRGKSYGRGNGSNGALLQKGLCPHCCIQYAAGYCLPTPPQETPQASLAQCFVGSLLLFPGSLCTQGFVCALQESVSPVLWKFYNQIPLAFKVKFPGGSQSLCQISKLGNLLWALELFNGWRTSLV